ncbi:MAG TPA: hypothetical protein VJN18_20160 [Polyangiaceae bacterium]|nr:hypothetical protein [Polyangiaceae bacterium]
MRVFFAFSAPILAGVLSASSAAAVERAFVYTEESWVLSPEASQLAPWTTFRLGRQRYFSRMDARLELEHGLLPRLQAALYWNFSTQSQDVVQDPLTGEIERVSESEFSGASFELKFQLSDPSTDLLGTALYLESTLGPRETEIEGKLIADLHLGKLLLAANLAAEYELTPIRNDEGTELETALALESALGAAFLLPRGFSLGLELRAPLGLTGDEKSSTLFGGPVVGWVDRGFWASLGVQPQLVALSGSSPDGHLDLTRHERLEVRLIAGWLL